MDLIRMFTNYLNAVVGRNQEFEELIKAKDISRVKELFSSREEMSAKALKEYDPKHHEIMNRKDKIVIKRKNIWDAYNIIAWITLIAFGCIVGVIAFNAETFKQNFASAFYGLIFVSTIIMIGALFVLFRKEKLVLKKHKVVHTHKYMLFSTKHDEIMKEDIESVEVTENPASGRFFVSLISENKTIAFGAKLPISDLQWIKKFLIHEIIK